ncbi:MAG: ABC transporter substrate-binding protein [Rubrivivax sp.]|nr:ABC transporter substrate-binding protein [Rubrivivax sp.]
MDKHMTLKRRTAMAWIGAVPLLARAQGSDWSKQLAAARGQTVFFNAWGGSERINSYLQWAAAELQPAFGIRLQHVKLSDTVEVVRRVRAEKAAGRSDGSADLVWINGENFLTMKREGLLFGPFAESLPNYRFVDTIGKPTTRVDFSEPVEGMEAPWGMAQLTFYADAGRLPLPPQSVAELTDWARRNPGRFTYPKPPQFHGTTFVKQALMALSPDRAVLARPYSEAAFATQTAPLWRALDALHPHLWRAGRQFPASTTVMRQMVADGELIIGLTFNPNEAANAIAGKQLPATVQSWQFSGGTIGNTHFLAIPFNARAAAAAQVVADFLLSPLAQARKADIRHWGDPTVLALDKLSAAQRAAFAASAQAPGAVRQPAPAWPEPHGSWVDPLEKEWLRRHGV